jgi:hypothetical protein
VVLWSVNRTPYKPLQIEVLVASLDLDLRSGQSSENVVNKTVESSRLDEPIAQQIEDSILQS